MIFAMLPLGHCEDLRVRPGACTRLHNLLETRLSFSEDDYRGVAGHAHSVKSGSPASRQFPNLLISPQSNATFQMCRYHSDWSNTTRAAPRPAAPGWLGPPSSGPLRIRVSGSVPVVHVQVGQVHARSLGPGPCRPGDFLVVPVSRRPGCPSQAACLPSLASLRTRFGPCRSMV